MTFARNLAVLAVLILPMAGCLAPNGLGGQREIEDEVADTYPKIGGRAWTAVPDAPAGAVLASWQQPGEQFPEYLVQIADPWNYPHLVWRGFYTIWSLPFNPLWYPTEKPTKTWDSYVSPIQETESLDWGVPPHGGRNPTEYWASRSNSFVKDFENNWGFVKYHLFNTNSYYPPYDRWYPEQIQREKTTIHKTLDLHFFDYDWDDPFVDSYVD